MSKLVEHARRELELIGEEPDMIDSLCKVVEAYDGLADSGGARDVILPMLVDLLDLRNLSPLTLDPDEWEEHDKDMWDGVRPVWQNKRNSQAFSEDEGRSFWLVNESQKDQPKIMHVSAPMKPRAVEDNAAAN